ncbi:hypothetical protein ACWDUN_27355 [Mycobacterium sp. NPDC003323]
MIAPQTTRSTVAVRRRLKAVGAGVGTAALMAVPTDIIDTPWFGREVPVRWWEYPTVVAIGLLTAVYVGVSAPPRAGGSAVGGITLAVLAIGCPVCNKLILAAIGTTGALNLWAPV